MFFAAARSFGAPPVAWAQAWQAGFDFRGTAGYVTDPPGDHPVLLSNTLYPTTSNGVTYGWTSTDNNQLEGWDRNASVDPRLAGMNAVLNSAPPAVFEVDLPSPGVYDVSLGIGDSGLFPMCTVTCQVQLKDGSNSLFVLTISGGLPLGSFADANGQVWSAASWPANNTTRQITMTGTKLTLFLGTGTGNSPSAASVLAFFGVAQQAASSPTFAVTSSPAAISVVNGNSGTSTITATSVGGFSSAISLTALGAPSGVQVSFNPASISNGSGTSTMTMAVGSSAGTGTYPITVTASGGGVTQTTSVNLTVTNSSQAWQAGFDFRGTAGYVTDPPGDHPVLLSNTLYPTTSNGVTYGWTSTDNNQLEGWDRNASVDPRLAGMNAVLNSAPPAVFEVDLPSPGVYDVSLGIGDSGLFPMCTVTCQVQLKDGSNSLFVLTISGGLPLGSFADANGQVWSAASWPANNTTRQITMTGTKLTLFLGTGTGNSPSAASVLAFFGVAQQGTSSPSFNFAASPGAVSVQEENSGTSTVTASSVGGFSSMISLSASGAPSGVQVSFSPVSISNGAGTSTMTMTVGSTVSTGTYPITVTASSGGITQTATVNLTITAPSDYTLAASPAAVSVATGNSGTSTMTTTSIGGFSATLSLSASGAPNGVQVSFSPATIANGAGSSTMTMAVSSTVSTGTYPITVTTSGGGITHTTNVSLTITAPRTFSLSASPGAVSVVTGNSGTSTITATSVGGFSSAISLTALGAPSGVQVSFNPASISNGSGTSTMTMAVGSSAGTGTYPITVTASGGGVTQTTSVNLTVTNSSQAWQAGFDFRGTAGYVTDPPGDHPVLLSNTLYPTTSNGVTYGWTSTDNNQLEGWDRNASVDPRLAGMNAVLNSAPPAVFEVDLPSPGVYDVSLGIGDSGLFPMCTVTCQVQLKDGSNSLFVLTISGGLPLGSFADANGQVWSAASWPANNTTRQITMTGTKLTLFLGTGTGNSPSAASVLAFFGVAQQAASSPTFAVTSSPAAISVVNGNSGTSTITATSVGGFSSAISLTALGAPSGVQVSFNPASISNGSGTSTMTMAVGSSAGTGTYPITVTASGGGVTQTTSVNLTVTNSSQAWQAGFDFRGTAGYVTDPPGDHPVLLSNTLYPTTSNGVTYGWTSTDNNQLEGLDRNASVDPRLAGMNAVLNSAPPAVFEVDLPSPGVYDVSLGIGDSGNFPLCTTSCQIEMRDGNTSLFVLTVSGGIALGSFADANGEVWTAGSWPTNNTTRQITMTGTKLSLLLGTGTGNSPSAASALSFFGIWANSSPGVAPTAIPSPTSLTFGSLVVETTSPAQTVTLSNSGLATLDITSIVSSGDFAQTNNCPTFLVGSNNCTMSVTFTPTTTGTRTGAIRIADNASISPQSVPLTGTGVTMLLAISPHVATLTVGRQQQFTSNMSASWSVDGIAGGNTAVGTISSSGLYTAPAAAGAHMITATGSGMTDTGQVYVSNYPGVFTYHNDNARTGQNTQETVLTPANVSATQFGKLLSVSLDSYVYAQPLYVSNLNFSGTIHNVVYVATEHNSLYAIDADNGTVIWQVSMIPAGATTGLPGDVNCAEGWLEIGITGTPVIDSASGTIYLVATTKENGSYVQRLHAIDLITHAEKFGGPVAIQATVSGTGDSSSGGVVSFDPQKEQQRPGLLLQNGQVSVGWASYCDARPYHGWIIAYNASNLTQQVGVFNNTPNGYQGGIWMSAGGLAGDANFNTYVATGNGDYDGNTEFGDSIVKLGPPSNDSFHLTDWFTPWDQNTMNDNDGDLGSGGVLLLPDLPSGSPHQHLLVEAGKEGTIYLVDRDNMGKFCSTCTNGDPQIVQELEKVLLNQLLATPAYWNGNVYFASNSMPVLAFSFNAGGSGLLSTSPIASSTVNVSGVGSSLVISANGNTNAIVWALDNNSFPNCCQVLSAFDAVSLVELYNSSQAPNNRDASGAALHFNVPMIANGKVYVASQNELVVYGLLPH